VGGQQSEVELFDIDSFVPSVERKQPEDEMERQR
jgi:hypothetical protein